ncbi:MAG: FCD domain-containing protein [Mobilicoccus sp.]|nr:FCD domain-containing protein [Mobilicoccus sp.]
MGVDLVTGALAAGTVLSIDQLEERYGVSRSVVREVVRVLEQLGVATSRRRVGVTVQPPTRWEALSPVVIRWRLAGPGRLDQLREISELRTGTEPVAAALAARRASPEQRARLVEAAAGMFVTGTAGDLDTYLQHDIVFHTTLLEASGNAAFASLAPLVAAALTGRTKHDLMPARPVPEAVRWHREIAEAVATGDAVAAEHHAKLIVAEAQDAVMPEETTTSERTVPLNPPQAADLQ